MTEKDSYHSESDDEYDRAIEHIVDTQGVSYAKAREIYGDRSVRASSDASPMPPYTNTEPYLGPFREEATFILDSIGRAKYRSQLNMNRVAPRLTQLVLKKVISQYEANALVAARRNRNDQLTHRNTTPPEEN